ncbi:M4 family metallopeptidase [Streptomyces sp. NBC_01275]|uniref:M4 family metallopeptidase n=1 Tax=Streptomyces sp. NBC_01275 TaxID=2903807 RepID=UPI0022531833|nr:M4 family metallopeptidase [Streptomyces sp. NBC_01275]MCX4763565.1 M4 family metallopeptidase [Streptomyces sp. NBC_01275]
MSEPQKSGTHGTPTGRRVVCGILPPYILHKLTEADDPHVREAARNTLAIDAEFRANRVATPSLVSPAMPEDFVLQRTIYDTHHTAELPGDVVREEGGQPVLDGTANRAYESLGLTFDFFKEVYGRHSIDDANLPLDATVHYRRRFNNAFWDTQQMVFGDGDGIVFNDFTISHDIVAHELTHGVTQYTAGLVYQDQAGALNESISDVFGSLVKQYARRQNADEADWLIGAGLFTPAVRGQALRSMKAPGTAFDDAQLGGADPQPSHMTHYVRGTFDHGGVHINSGIPNHAFYLTAVAIGGYAWERAGKIWYDTITSGRLAENATFEQFAHVTADVAEHLYGTRSELDAVMKAWSDVGVNVNGA